jgi:glycosyltransferase involved in cell wall biosynthesis
VPKGSSPLVSVVIPVYNGGKYINEAIDSILGQDYPRVELFVLDDGSTDDTLERIKRYDGRFYWETHPNRGQANTLNRGWQIAKGEILSYLGADDALLPGAVSTSVRYLLENEDVVLTYCDYYLMDTYSDIVRRVYAPEFNYHDMVVRINCSPGPGVFFRRDVLQTAGLWDPHLRQMPDYDYWIRLGLVGSFKRIPEPLAKFRVHENSQSYAESDEQKSEEIIHVMNSYFQLPGIPRHIMEAKDEALSKANIIAARLHLRAGRYGEMFSHLRNAWRLRFLSLFSLQTFKLLGNGLLYRMRKVAS